MRTRRNPIHKRILTEIEDEVRVHSHYADLQHLLALILMTRGEMEKAESHFLQALKLNPRYREAAVNLACLKFETGQWKEGDRNDFKKKFNLTGGALEKIQLSRPYAQCHNFTGLYLAKKGRYDQAVKQLKIASRVKPDDFIFHANLGTVYYYQGAYRKAIDQFQEALKINPAYGMGYANLSYVYGLMGRSREALRHMRKAVQLHPRYADLRYHLALLYSDRKRYEEAVTQLKQALRINPNYLFARINLGVAYEDQKKWKEARREYRRILDVMPDDEHIRNRLERIS